MELDSKNSWADLSTSDGSHTIEAAVRRPGEPSSRASRPLAPPTLGCSHSPSLRIVYSLSATPFLSLLTFRIQPY